MTGKAVWQMVIMICAMLCTTGLEAHNPLVFKGDTKGFADALKIPRPAISYAIYSNLETASDVDFYSFQVNKPMLGHVTLIVPVLEGYQNFYPVFAVVGPGLPDPKTDLPFALPSGYGAVVELPTRQDPRPVFFEPFSRKSYYRGIGEFKQHLTQTGTYYIVVWHPGCETGAYVVGYGDKEMFTLRDWVNVFKVMPTIKNDSWMVKRSKPASGECPRTIP